MALSMTCSRLLAYKGQTKVTHHLIVATNKRWEVFVDLMTRAKATVLVVTKQEACRVRVIKNRVLVARASDRH